MLPMLGHFFLFGQLVRVALAPLVKTHSRHVSRVARHILDVVLVETVTLLQWWYINKSVSKSSPVFCELQRPSLYSRVNTPSRSFACLSIATFSSFS